jgi:hypothetical protein
LFEVGQGAFGVAALPGVESLNLAVLEQLHDAFGSVPGSLVLAE